MKKMKGERQSRDRREGTYLGERQQEERWKINRGKETAEMRQSGETEDHK
jgi:hypothetical protein